MRPSVAQRNSDAPIFFNPGLGSFTDIQTLAALGILQHVCKVATRYGTRVIVTTVVPPMVPICEEIMKSAFNEAGRPEMAKTSEVRFVSDRSDLAALSNSRILVEEKVASNFIFGSYDFTALLLSEGGQIAGCMQIAGTTDFYQIAFFIPTCDYVIIAEELTMLGVPESSTHVDGERRRPRLWEARPVHSDSRRRAGSHDLRAQQPHQSV